MKPLFTVFFIFLLSMSYAQNWCPTGAEWKYRMISMGGYDEEISIKYQKDTVVESQSCKKLSVTSDWTNYPAGTNGTYERSPYFTYEQNDTVFFYYQQAFRPLYYFNAQVGDTLSAYTFDGICDTFYLQVVDSIGTRVIDSTTLHFYRVNEILSDPASGFGNADIITEKIGSMDYILPQLICYTDGDYYEFDCYQDSSMNSCPILGISETNKTSFYIYPNPAVDFVTISFDDNKTHDIILLNMFGQIVLSKSIAQKEDVNVSTLSQGIYFIKTDNDFLIQKLIIK